MVVDTSALVAFALGEPAAAEVARCLSEAESLCISTATALECALVIGRKLGKPGEDKLDELLREAGVELIAFDTEQLALARAAYRRFGKGTRHPAQLNYGDCFAYALAKQRGEALLFVGDDFAQTDVAAALG